MNIVFDKKLWLCSVALLALAGKAPASLLGTQFDLDTVGDGAVLSSFEDLPIPGVYELSSTESDIGTITFGFGAERLNLQFSDGFDGNLWAVASGVDDFRLNFSSLEWSGQPGEIVGITQASNIPDWDSSRVTFTGTSVTVEIDGLMTGAVRAPMVAIDLETIHYVSDGGTTALLGLLAFGGLGFMRRFVK